MPSERPVTVSRCFIRNERGLILAVQRAMTDRHNPGLWECPGGKFDKKEDLTTAQGREVHEETGFLVVQTYPLVFPYSYVIPDGPYKDLPYVALFSIARPVGGSLELSEEHINSDWLLYDHFLDLELTTETRKAAIALRPYLT